MCLAACQLSAGGSFIISGEVITENDIRLFEKYGIDEIEVVASESTVKQLQ